MASYSIAAVRAISPFYQAKLKAAGIRSTAKLLNRAATPKLRKELAKKTAIPTNLILDWANVADLTRVPGVAVDYAELLVAAEVDTVADLKRRNPAKLVARMQAANAQRKLVALLPSERRVTRWIEAAKSLAPGMDH
jgi:Domain of unknown function (DUF4332)